MRLNGDMLRDARDRMDKEQVEMAATLKMTVQTISRAENGHNLRRSTAHAILAYLKLGEEAVIQKARRNGNHAA